MTGKSLKTSKLIEVFKSDNNDRKADVIFVHGINADPRSTWMTDNNPEGFPNTSWLYWLGEDITDVAVWSLGYPASATYWTGFTMPLRERADNIINLLLNHPQLDQNRPIIFVAHSMGGLLVKNMLRRAKSGDYPNADSLVQQTKGIVFLSTPHIGANLANFIDHLAFLLPTVNIKELKKDDSSLHELNDWFIRNFNDLNLQEVQVFCETQPTPVKRWLFGRLIRKVVVDKNSAKLVIENVNVTPLDTDHSSICWVKDHQFRNTNQLYSNVLKFISNITGNAGIQSNF